MPRDLALRRDLQRRVLSTPRESFGVIAAVVLCAMAAGIGVLQLAPLTPRTLEIVEARAAARRSATRGP